jgi:hypothetical protein
MIDARPILQIVTSIPKRHEDEFNDFYHHEYIPIILKVFPEIVKARRYEEYNTDASLRYYFKQWVTIYELESEAAIEPLLKAQHTKKGASTPAATSIPVRHGTARSAAAVFSA